ncbi:MAG: hypothetical protein GX981_04610 [Tissierellia bacterium]|nr:hypothetical protein [Tissierellia bacterium]
MAKKRRIYLIFHYIITILAIIIATLGMIYNHPIGLMVVLLIGIREIIRIKHFKDVYESPDMTGLQVLIILFLVLQYGTFYVKGYYSVKTEILVLFLALIVYTIAFIYYFDPFNKNKGYRP